MRYIFGGKEIEISEMNVLNKIKSKNLKGGEQKDHHIKADSVQVRTLSTNNLEPPKQTKHNQKSKQSKQSAISIIIDESRESDSQKIDGNNSCSSDIYILKQSKQQYSLDYLNSCQSPLSPQQAQKEEEFSFTKALSNEYKNNNKPVIDLTKVLKLYLINVQKGFQIGTMMVFQGSYIYYDLQQQNDRISILNNLCNEEKLNQITDRLKHCRKGQQLNVTVSCPGESMGNVCCAVESIAEIYCKGIVQVGENQYTIGNDWLIRVIEKTGNIIKAKTTTNVFGCKM